MLVRAFLKLLGEGQFAVYQIVTAALAWLSLASLGLGPAMKNLVSETRARNKSDVALRETCTSLLAAVFLVATGLVIVLSPLAANRLLDKLSHDQLWSARALAVGGVLTIITVLGQVSMEVLYAELRAHVVYLFSIVAGLFTIVGVWWLDHCHLPTTELFFWAVVATTAPPALSGVAALWTTGLLRLRLAYPDRDVLDRLRRLALKFWVFALLSNLILLVDSIVIAQILDSRDIVMYSVLMKFAITALAFFSTAIAVVWPEWTRNWELHQWDALRKRVRSMGLIGFAVCTPGAIVAIFALPAVIRLWLGQPNLIMSTTLVVEFVGYIAIRFWTDTHSGALMSGNRVGPSMAFAICQALLTAPLEYFLGRAWGSEGVILGLIIGFLATSAWMFPVWFYREMHRGIAESGRAA